MPLWDRAIVASYEPEVMSTARREEAIARETNGFVKQTDWWAMNKKYVNDPIIPIAQNGIVEFLKQSTKDVRHVAVLLYGHTNLDWCEVEQIFAESEIDGSTFLVHYLNTLVNLLEGYYASGNPVGHHPFVVDGTPLWKYSNSGLQYLMKAASLVGSEEKTFSFDCGRMQLLYKAMQDDLEQNGVKPDWFVDASELLPFQGVEPVCNVTFWDYEVIQLPENHQVMMIEELSLVPDHPTKRKPSNLFGLLKRH